MATNQRNLKAFVRFDGSGRIVVGSLILRKNKPKVGKWKEIQAYECCNYEPITITFNTGDSLPITYPGVTIFCNGSNVAYQYVIDGTLLTTVDQLVDSLNTAENTRTFGIYKNAGNGNIQLTASTYVKNLCISGALTFTIYGD